VTASEETELGQDVMGDVGWQGRSQRQPTVGKRNCPLGVFQLCLETPWGRLLVVGRAGDVCPSKRDRQPLLAFVLGCSARGDCFSTPHQRQKSARIAHPQYPGR